MSTTQILLAALVVCAVVIVVLAVLLINARRQLRHSRRRGEALHDQLGEVYNVPEVNTALGVPAGVALIINPTKTEAPHVERLMRHFARLMSIPTVHVLTTTADDPGFAMTRDALAKGAQLVLVAGGDGTVRSVAEALSTHAATHGVPPVPMGIIPIGTGNLLARNLELPVNDLEACMAIAFTGAPQPTDVLDLVITDDAGATSHAVSTVISGIGFDAEVMHDTNDTLKQAAGWLAYTEPGMRKLFGDRKTISLSIDDGPAETLKVRSVMVANCGLLTGGIELVPDAKINDGLLDVVLLAPRTLWDWTQVTLRVILRRPDTKAHLVTHQARKVRVELPEPQIAQLDGDGIDHIRALTATINPGALNIMVPREPEPTPDTGILTTTGR